MTTDDSIKNHHDGDDENTLKNNVETELSTERPLVVTKMNPWKIPEVNTSTTASTAQSSTFHNHSANTTHGTTSPDGESILNNGFTTTKKNVISFQSIMDQQQKEEEKEKSKQKVSNNFTTQEEDEEEKMIRLAIEASLKDEEMRKQYDQQQEYIDYHHYNLVDTATDAAVADVNDEQYKEDHIQNNTIIHNMEIVHDKKNDDHDSMDEDMKFAIRLSLQEQQQQRKCRYDKDGFEILPDSINKGSTEQYHKVTGDDKEMEKNPSPSNRLTPLDQQSITAEHNDNTTGIDTTILSSVASIPTSSSLTKEEEEQIAKALMDADNEEMAKSVQLAMKLADEEEQYYKDTIKHKEPESAGESHVRIVNHYEWNDLRRQKNNSNDSSEQQNPLWGKDDYDLHQQYYNNDHKYELEDDDIDEVSGFQMNKNIPSSQWSRLDKNTIIGPNNEIRTKHDVALKNQTNAKKLLSSTSSINVKKQDGKVSVSDVAYNSFHRSLKNAMKRSTVKGVAAHGTGRAENMNAEKTRGGAMDGNVRLLISKAVTNGLIQYCNGVVKEGKEAIVYHADGNNDMDSKSRGFDVAVKVFKRIQEFKGRGAYIDGDPRYHGKKFRDIDSREQIELWTEKEYRNLVRANRAGVPVPTPILQKENVLFMRFLGNDGWPSPQLREVELKKGSKIWTGESHEYNFRGVVHFFLE